MPQHRDLRHPLDAHPCPTRTRRENLGDFRRTRHSRTVFLPDDRTLGEQIEAMRKHQDANSPISTPAPAGRPPPGDATHQVAMSLDLVQVAPSTQSPLMA